MHILDYIEEKAHIRRENWTTREVEILPPAEWMKETCIVSRYTRLGMSSHRRYLWSPLLVRVNGYRETPSSVARDYLMGKYKHSPKWTGAQRERIKKELSQHPLYCKPCNFEHGFYIDLAAAYWSVMLRCGWNVDYYPSRWLGLRLPPLDFPWMENKRARNSLVSVGMSTGMTMYHHGKNRYFTQTKFNPRANSQLYCLITDTLNAIANEVIAVGAVYVFTDGYIAPNERVAQDIMKIVTDWGFTARVKGEGKGEVTGLGSYVVGKYRSKHLQKNKADYKSTKKVEYHGWLRKRMAKARALAFWHDDFIDARYHGGK